MSDGRSIESNRLDSALVESVWRLRIPAARWLSRLTSRSLVEADPNGYPSLAHTARAARTQIHHSDARSRSPRSVRCSSLIRDQPPAVHSHPVHQPSLTTPRIAAALPADLHSPFVGAMAAERSDGAAGFAAAAAAAARPAFLSQSVADRRAEVEAWSVRQADKFCAVIALRLLGMSGLQLWNISPAQIPSSFHPSFGSLIDAMRTAGHAGLSDHERRLINVAAGLVRRATLVHFAAAPADAAGAAAAAAAGAAAASSSAPAAAAAASSSSAAAAKRASDSSLDGSPAKRVRFASSNISGDEEESEEVSPDESRWAQREYQRSQVHPAAAALSASAAPSTALFRELPSSSNDPTPQTAPLSIDSLPQEWFVDPVPNELICSVCLDVARDPPNLEACGQSHSHESHCHSLSAEAQRLMCACFSLCDSALSPCRVPRMSDQSAGAVDGLSGLPPVVRALQARLAAIRAVDGVAAARAMRAARQGLSVAGTAGHGDERAQGARRRLPLQTSNLPSVRQGLHCRREV